jgi:site-specific recombinase XerC
MLRDAVKDKGYRAYPLGQDAEAYLRAKRKRLTTASYRDYEGGLDKFVRYFLDLRLQDFEPPIGTRRAEEFLDAQYGDRAARTHNKNLSILRDFFKWAVLRGELHGDPTLPIERARARGVYRTGFNTDQRRAIIASQEDLRDRTALRLLLDYGLRKGALTAVQFKHFDHHRRRLTIFTKGEKIRELPIPDPMFCRDLERIILEHEAEPGHYLMRGRHANQHGTVSSPPGPSQATGCTDWWYRCLQNAGIVPTGITAGERMHKARYTAGQRVLDHTGNLKAVQKLLGHASIQTTADVYVDWDLDQLATTVADVLAEEEDE